MSAEIYLKRMMEFAKKAGEVSLRYRDDSDPGLKPDQTVITKADKEISALCRMKFADIIDGKEHIMVDEEDPAVASYLDQGVLDRVKYVWSLDPIDGTRLYANRMPTFGVSLGVLKDLKPWLGVVYFPVLDELFFSDGQYAYFVSDAFSEYEQRRLIVPIDEQISPQSLFFCNDTFFRKYNWSDKDFHIMIHACAVVNLCWPAIGRGMGCFLKSSLWDFAGSWPIMKAAGMDFRRVSDGRVLERIEASLFMGNAKHWELKDYHMISSKRNFDIIRSKIVGL